MKILNYFLKISAIVFVISLVGCSSKSVNYLEWNDPSGTRDLNEANRVITDSKLARRILVESLNTYKGEDGHLQVQIHLQNLTKKLQSVEYRFDWLDSNNMIFETPSSRWVIKHIFGGDSIVVTSVAPKDTIQDFKFKIKRR
jgi:uncharacterized protein YcfL